jgi:ribosomal protein L11 methylase PrmA
VATIVEGILRLYSVFVVCEPAEEDLLIAKAWEAGTMGIVEEPGGFRAFFEDDASIDGVLAGEVRSEVDRDWAQATRDSFPPLRIGRRFFLVPPWSGAPTPAGRLRLVVNPGMACGTGWHPCTQMCLEAMERYLRLGDTVLDVGSGSGILSEAARLLGAGAVVGCDIDPDVKPPFVGTADAVRTASADLLVSNISAAAVDELAGEFQRVVKPGGTLILSGFTESEVPEQLRTWERLQKAEWVCLVATGARPSDSPIARRSR